MLSSAYSELCLYLTEADVLSRKHAAVRGEDRGIQNLNAFQNRPTSCLPKMLVSEQHRKTEEGKDGWLERWHQCPLAKCTNRDRASLICNAAIHNCLIDLHCFHSFFCQHQCAISLFHWGIHWKRKCLLVHLQKLPFHYYSETSGQTQEKTAGIYLVNFISLIKFMGWFSTIVETLSNHRWEVREINNAEPHLHTNGLYFVGGWGWFFFFLTLDTYWQLKAYRSIANSAAIAIAFLSVH